MNDEEMARWQAAMIARHPDRPHHADGELCDMSALCGPEDRCGCKKTPDALQCAEGQNETHVAADSEEKTMAIVPPCPPWCVIDHGPQPNYHSTAITTIEALDADLTVQLTYDDTADPEHLIELHVGHVVLMTSTQARRLMGALERLVEA